MSDSIPFKNGTFCWVELATTDIDEARKFYGQLFGLETKDESMPEWTYWMFMKGDKATAGLTNLKPEAQEMGAPSHWLNYVGCTDTEATFNKAVELGAEALMPIQDVPEAGKMGLLKDPEGAVFALWQPFKENEQVHRNFDGAFCWQEKGTNNMQGSKDFYKDVFGWNGETKGAQPMPYTTFYLEGNMEAGMYEIQEHMKDVPPHWMVYFMTDDIDTLMGKVEGLGGQIILPITPVPEVGRISVIMDPQGAVFGVVGEQLQGIDYESGNLILSRGKRPFALSYL